jgi:hypothetical protein
MDENSPNNGPPASFSGVDGTLDALKSGMPPACDMQCSQRILHSYAHCGKTHDYFTALSGRRLTIGDHAHSHCLPG